MIFVVTMPWHSADCVAWHHVLAVCSAGDWVNFDDSQVMGPLQDSEIVTSNAYILFYRRREEASKADGALSDQSMPMQYQDNCTVCFSGFYSIPDRLQWIA